MNKNPIEWLCCGFAAILTIAQTNEMFQLIELISTIIATLVALSYTIWKWYRNAKKDGKITEEEVDELVDDIKEAADKIEDETHKENK